MRNLTQYNITQAVIARLAQTPDERLREVMTSLVQHLHAVARDVQLTAEEWFSGDSYLDFDAVFRVRESLIADWARQADGSYLLQYEFVLNPCAGPSS